MSAPDLDLSVDVAALFRDPATTLLPVLSCLPGWDQVSAEGVTAKQISGAMTNIIYRCNSNLTEEWVLVRVYGGVDDLFEREAECQIFAAVAQAGLGPRLLASFGNGRIEEFLLDQNIDAALVKTPKIAAITGAALACFHFTSLPRLHTISQAAASVTHRGPPEPHAEISGSSSAASQARTIPSGSRANGIAHPETPDAQAEDGQEAEGPSVQPILWGRLQAWASKVAELCPREQLQEHGLLDICEEIEELEGLMRDHVPSWLGFCHNDLQYGNMLLHVSSPQALTQDKMRSAASAEMAIATESLGESELTDDDFVSLGASPRGSYAEAISEPAFSMRHDLPQSKPERRSTPLGRSSLNMSRQAKERILGSSPPAHEFAELLRDPWRVSKTSASAVNRLSVRFIDYEYAGFNPVAYDFANHWCEYAADYHTAHPHVMDYGMLPDVHMQRVFLRAYVNAVLALQQHMAQQGTVSSIHDFVERVHRVAPPPPQETPLGSPPPPRPDEGDMACCVTTSADKPNSHLPTIAAASSADRDGVVEQLRLAGQAYMPICHLHWGLWALIMVRTSKVRDFDFGSYGRQRLQMYREGRAGLLDGSLFRGLQKQGVL